MLWQKLWHPMKKLQLSSNSSKRLQLQQRRIWLCSCGQRWRQRRRVWATCLRSSW